MLRTLGRIAVLVLPLVAAGCASYQRQPLEPAAELAALGQRTLGDFVVERAAEPQNLAFDPSDGLDETEVVAVALALNPDIRAKRMEIGEGRALLVQAGLWPNPEVGVGWRSGIGGATGTTVDADALWELLKPWERSARKDVAAARIEERRAEIEAEEWKLVTETRLQHLAVRSREQASSLLDEELALRERALEIVKRRKELGEVTELEASVAELEVAEARRDRRGAETESASARRELNRLLGLPPQYDLRLSESGRPLDIVVYDDLTDEELERRLLAGRSDLRALECAYESAEHQLRLAVYGQYPGLRLGPSYGKEPEGDGFFGFGVALELPFFNRNQGEIAEKENLRDRARAAYVGLLHRLKANAVEARAGLRRARLEVAAQEKEVLPLIRRNQELFEGAFRAGELGVLDWVTARQRTLKARQAYLETLARYRSGVIELEAATGLPLSRPVEEGSKGD